MLCFDYHFKCVVCNVFLVVKIPFCDINEDECKEILLDEEEETSLAAGFPIYK